MSSNYIKYWWLCLRFKNKSRYGKYILCTIKTNELYNDYIFIYTYNNFYNKIYKNICEKYIKSYKENCIISCFNNIFKKTNDETAYKDYPYQIVVMVHPYTKLNPDNIVFEDYDFLHFENNEVSFNTLKLKNILYYNYTF